MPTRTTLQLCSEAALQIAKDPSWLDREVGKFNRWMDEADKRLVDAQEAQRVAALEKQEAAQAMEGLTSAIRVFEILVQDEMSSIEVSRREVAVESALVDKKESSLNSRQRDLEVREQSLRETDVSLREEEARNRVVELDRRAIYLSEREAALNRRCEDFTASLAAFEKKEPGT